jgi:signal recognition particle subunit SEC65
VAQLEGIRSLSLTGATLTKGLGFPDPAHLANVVTALQELGESVPVVDDLREPRFWEASSQRFRRTNWEA